MIKTTLATSIGLMLSVSSQAIAIAPDHYLPEVLAVSFETLKSEDIPSVSKVYERVNVSPKELSCLAKTVYFEARNQSDDGKAGVAYVAVKRASNHSICKEIYSKPVVKNDKLICAYQWTCDDKTKSGKIANFNAYHQATLIAYGVMTGEIPDPTNGADHYLAKSEEKHTYWVKDMRKDSRIVIDDQVFYASNE